MKKIRSLLFILFLLMWALPVLPQGNIYAVLIGISEYEHPGNNLTYSHRDAMAMYELLKDYTTPDRMILLTNQQARRDHIVYYAEQLFRQAKPEDIVIFFFSGHGEPNVFYAYDNHLNFNELYGIFKQTNARQKLIFADASFSGTLRQSGNRAASDDFNAEKNVLVFLSSRSDQYSREDISLRNGMFTYFLLAGLKGNADVNSDSCITAIELFNFVNPKVKERTNGNQVPVMWGKFDKNMIILKRKSNE